MKRIAFTIGSIAQLGAFTYVWFVPAQVLKRRTQRILHTLTRTNGVVGGR